MKFRWRMDIRRLVWRSKGSSNPLNKWGSCLRVARRWLRLMKTEGKPPIAAMRRTRKDICTAWARDICEGISRHLSGEETTRRSPWKEKEGGDNTRLLRLPRRVCIQNGGYKAKWPHHTPEGRSTSRLINPVEVHIDNRQGRQKTLWTLEFQSWKANISSKNQSQQIKGTSGYK